MGSEVVSVGLEGGAERGRECDGAWRGVAIAGGGKSGAMVSWLASRMAASPSTVASGSAPSIGLPHFAQNRAVAGTLLPQEMQNMEAKFYHSLRRITNSITQSADLFDLNCGPIGQHFRHTLHHFVGVIAHG
jgi:hypothetical protein